MVSTSDVQQAVFAVVFTFSIIVLHIMNNRKGIYDTLLPYFPWLAEFTSIEMRVLLGFLSFASMIAVILMREFSKQDKPI